MWYTVISDFIPIGGEFYGDSSLGKAMYKTAGSIFGENYIPGMTCLDEAHIGDVLISADSDHVNAWQLASRGFLDHEFYPSVLYPELCGQIRKDTKTFCRASRKFHTH